MPGICRSGCAARGCGWARCRSGRACRDAAARRAPRSTVPCSTIRPAYITAIVVGEAGDHRQIVGDPDQRGAGTRAQSFCISDRICALDGHVERRGRLVGDDQRRACAAARWRSPRAGACRRRTGADRRAAAPRARGCRPGRAHRGQRAELRLAAPSSCASTVSIICVSMRSTGFSVIIGSWKIIAMRLPRSRAHLRLAQVARSLALEQDLPAGDAARADRPAR